MKRHTRSHLQRSQKSVFYYSDIEGQEDPVLRSRPRYFDLPTTHMLIEDIELSIMPIGGRSKNASFQVVLRPSNPQVEDLVVAAIGRSELIDDLARATSDFFRNCSRTIIAFGESIYEIVYLSDPDSNMIVGFQLAHIQPRTVFYRKNKLIQYVPADVASDRNISQYIELSPEHILTFYPPPRFKLDTTMEELASFKGPFAPDFAFRNTSNHPIVFDYKVHLHSQRLAYADIGKEIGWNARGSFQEEILEYYFMHRQLLFEEFKIRLRDSILNTLNNGLERAGQRIGFSAELKFEGLPTLTDVKTAQGHLAKGNMPFNQILEPFLTL